MRSRTESTDCRTDMRRLSGRGQGTVEYALVTAAFIAIALGLGVLWRFLAEGGFASGVQDSLTHRLLKGVADLVLF